MLKYLTVVTEDVLLISTLCSLLFAACSLATGKAGRKAQTIGILAGVAASILMSIAKNATSKIATNRWNQSIFYLTILFTVLFVLFSLISFGFSKKEKNMGISAGIANVCAAALTFLLIFYELPDVMAYPFKFDTGGEGVLTVAWLVRFLGWAGALILCAVFARFLYKCAMSLEHKGVTLFLLDIGLLANAVRCLGQTMRPWVTGPKWFRMPPHSWIFPPYKRTDFPWAFGFTSFVHNNTLLFTGIAACAALLIPVLLFFRSVKVRGLWSNPAQLRRLKAVNLHNRRWAAIVTVCFVLGMLNLTVVKAYTNQEVELSAPEEYTIRDDGNICIPLEEVADGNLHRYEYKTENGIDVRWIIVKKPGTAAYGVGLDACDVCGNAGYYQRGQQIVCKRCDVVMNINTIGFKGGCNPIPLESTVKDGYIVIPLEKVIAGEKEFK